jgi:AraC family transcriptional regulator
MEIVQRIMKAIHFMDHNLLNDITYHDVADNVYMSSFHFHRTFKILTGITPNEYIRNRRLSLAGEELTLSDKSVLDIAMKYQYDSLEGFSKAFRRFHNVTPIKVKQGKVMLKTFHPLKINISFEGGKSMDYKVMSLEPFTVLAKTREFEIDAEINLIPSFWDEQIELGLVKQLSKVAIEPGLYGICQQIEPRKDTFNYGIGVKVSNDANIEGLNVWKIDNPLWAVFECENTKHIGEVWKVILEEFFINSIYERVEELDFELYLEDRPDIFCQLYIPIRKVK